MSSTFFPTRQMLPINILLMDPEAQIPKYAHSDDSGFDLVTLDELVISPDEVVLARTGLAFEIPDGFELQIRPRSGFSLKHPIIIPNAPATIDAGYRGEVKIILRSIAKISQVIIPKGTRIAQGVICPVAKAIFVKVTQLHPSSRGEGGFGSTGEKA